MPFLKNQNFNPDCNWLWSNSILLHGFIIHCKTVRWTKAGVESPGSHDASHAGQHKGSSGDEVLWSPVEARGKAQETPWVMHNESRVILSNLSFRHFQGSNPYCSRFKSLLFKV